MAVRSTWVTSSVSSSASSPGTWLEVRVALLGQGNQVLEDAIGGGAGDCAPSSGGRDKRTGGVEAGSVSEPWTSP